MYLPAAGLGTRHTQTLLLFLSMLLLYCMRVNISLAIVDMTDTTKEGVSIKQILRFISF